MGLIVKSTFLKFIFRQDILSSDPLIHDLFIQMDYFHLHALVFACRGEALGKPLLSHFI
jgi:hypothetical protein